MRAPTKTSILVFISIIAFFGSRMLLTYNGKMEGFYEVIPFLIQLLIIFFVVRWISEATLKNQIKFAKKDPDKFKKLHIDDSVVNKDSIIMEIEKFDEIKKIDTIQWIKNTFKKSKGDETKEKKLEILVNTIEGQEQWYEITSKNKKILKIEKQYKPVT